MSEWSWGTRKPGEMTTEYLGRVLESVGKLDDMPKRAREGHFDDYFAPPEVADGMELLRLVAELHTRKRTLWSGARKLCEEIIEAVKEGEFDATREESDRWMASKDGQDTFKQLGIDPSTWNPPKA